MVRSIKEFDSWILSKGGDPWGYQTSSEIKKRLYISFKVLKKTVYY